VTTTFSIVPAKPWHCGQMCRLLRHERRRATALVGMDAHRELRELFDQSAFRRAWLADGEMIGLGGVTGSLLAPRGYVWLALSEMARRYPLAVVKQARRQLDEIMVTKRELATTIIGGDEAAKRLAVFLGFHVQDEGPGQPAYSRYGRRTLHKHLETETELRIPVGRGYAIPMGYHHQFEGTF
jgi:hypothetical protein